jgi:hypothetical protein
MKLTTYEKLKYENWNSLCGKLPFALLNRVSSKVFQTGGIEVQFLLKLGTKSKVRMKKYARKRRGDQTGFALPATSVLPIIFIKSKSY